MTKAAKIYPIYLPRPPLLWVTAALALLPKRGTGGPPNTVSLAGGHASRMSWPTGFQPVDSAADRRDALSALTGGTPVFRSKRAKLTVLGGPPVASYLTHGQAAVPFLSAGLLLFWYQPAL